MSTNKAILPTTLMKFFRYLQTCKKVHNSMILYLVKVYKVYVYEVFAKDTGTYCGFCLKQGCKYNEIVKYFIMFKVITTRVWQIDMYSGNK